MAKWLESKNKTFDPIIFFYSQNYVFYSDFNFERPILDRVLHVKKYNGVKSIYFAFRSFSKKNYSKKFIFGQVGFLFSLC